MKRIHMADYLSDAHQKIPHLVVKTTFLGEVEAEIGIGSKL